MVCETHCTTNRSEKHRQDHGFSEKTPQASCLGNYQVVHILTGSRNGDDATIKQIRIHN